MTAAHRIALALGIAIGLGSAVGATAESGLEAGRRHRDAGAYPQCEAVLLDEIDAVERGSLAEAEHLDVLVYCMQRNARNEAEETLALAERALQIKERHLGPDDPSLAPSLRNLARTVWGRSDPAAAYGLYDRARSLQEPDLGRRSTEVGLSLLGMANAQRTLDSTLSEQLYVEAIDIFSETLGPANSQVALALNSYGRLLRREGRTEEAIDATRRAIDIFVAAEGEEHVRTGILTANLGLLYKDEGNLPLARQALERSLRVRQAVLPAEHVVLGRTHHDLGRVLQLQGDVELAIPHLENAVRIREREEPTAALSSCRALGDAYIETYEFERALSVLYDALDVAPEDAAETAITYNLLGKLHRALGDYDQAAAHFETSLDLHREHFGEKSQRVATSLSNLADVEWYRGDVERASELAQAALGTGKLGRDDFARVVTNLAWYTLDLQQYEFTHQLLGQARSVFTDSYGDESAPMVSLELIEAQLAEAEGDFSTALAHYDRAFDVHAKTAGPSHPLSAVYLEDRALCESRSGQEDLAFETALTAEARTREFLRLAAQSLPERHALRLKPQMYAGLELALTLAVDSGDPTRVRRAWEALVASRALVLDEMGTRRASLAATRSTDLRARMEALRAARARLVKAALSDRTPPTDLDRLRQEKEQHEAEVARLGRNERIEPTNAAPTLSDLSTSLPAGAALLSYAQILEPEHRPSTERHYLAFVMTADGVSSVRLGDGQHIDDLVESWRHEVEAGALETPSSNAELLRSYREAGRALREAIWDPVAGQLASARDVFVVPDGQLHLVSLGSLPIGEEKYLIESGRSFHRLTAERDLTRPERPIPTSSRFLAVGGARFTLEGDPDATPPSASECMSLADLRFEELPATQDEVAEVARLWSEEAMVLTGAEANEARFRREAPNRQILHLATHGFFLDGDCAFARSGTRGIGSVVKRDASPREGRRTVIESPFLLCGLAFAGANDRIATPASASEDGILMAEEILDLDLSATRWAVLSACDTGVGRVESGEGVLGLQRAFQLAGVHTLIMSLWPVDDEATRAWMRELYRSRWQEGRSTAAAMRAATRQILQARRQNGQSLHPFHWGAFVSAGDWR